MWGQMEEVTCGELQGLTNTSVNLLQAQLESLQRQVSIMTRQLAKAAADRAAAAGKDARWVAPLCTAAGGWSPHQLSCCTDHPLATCRRPCPRQQLSTRAMIHRDRTMQRLGLYAVEELPKPGGGDRLGWQLPKGSARRSKGWLYSACPSLAARRPPQCWWKWCRTCAPRWSAASRWRCAGGPCRRCRTSQRWYPAWSASWAMCVR